MIRRMLPLIIILILRKRLSVKKISNILSNYIKGFLLRVNGRAKFPSIMMIEPTNICNLQCTFCALQLPGGCSAEEKRLFINQELFLNLDKVVQLF